MKKGFTLAELLGVIAVLGIIAMIAFPLMDRSITDSDEKLYNTQINQIIKGAKSYYADNLDLLNQITEDKQGEVSLETLQKEGYLPIDIKNPRTEKNFEGETQIIVTKENNKYNYEVIPYEK